MQSSRGIIALACAGLFWTTGQAVAQSGAQLHRTLFNTRSGYIAPTFDDYNGDGVAEFLGYNMDNQSIDLISGLTGALLRRYTGVPQHPNMGIRLATIPDADGDGRRDTLIGGESDVWALKSSAGSGALGVVPELYSFHGEVAGPFFAVAGPVTMIATSDMSRALLIDSGTGAVQARITNSAAGANGTLGQSAVNLGDVNGDGVPDFASSGGNVSHAPAPMGSLWVLSGTTTTAGLGYEQLSGFGPSQRLAELTGLDLMGAGSTTGQGNTTVNLGDPVPGDGQPQSLVVTGSPWGNFARGGLVAHVLSAGPGGTVNASMVAAYNHTSASLFGTAVEDVGDMNGDGVRDVAVLDPGFLVSNQPAGRILIVSGAGLLDGYQPGIDVLQTIVGHPQAYFARSMHALGDYDNDGLRDLAISVYYNGLNGQFGPAIQIYSVPSPGGLAVLGMMVGGLRRRRR